jgi:hypothetical protein
VEDGIELGDFGHGGIFGLILKALARCFKQEEWKNGVLMVGRAVQRDEL